MEANDIMESAKELCSTVNITLDYEAPVHVSRQDSRRSACPREFCEHLKAACCSHAPGRVGNDVSPARMLIF